MNTRAIRAWLGQATTGGGIAALLGTVSAFAAGQLTLPQAAPLLAAGAISVIWPENVPNRRHKKHRRSPAKRAATKRSVAWVSGRPGLSEEPAETITVVSHPGLERALHQKGKFATNHSTNHKSNGLDRH